MPKINGRTGLLPPIEGQENEKKRVLSVDASQERDSQ